MAPPAGAAGDDMLQPISGVNWSELSELLSLRASCSPDNSWSDFHVLSAGLVWFGGLKQKIVKRQFDKL